MGRLFRGSTGPQQSLLKKKVFFRAFLVLLSFLLKNCDHSRIFFPPGRHPTRGDSSWWVCGRIQWNRRLTDPAREGVGWMVCPLGMQPPGWLAAASGWGEGRQWPGSGRAAPSRASWPGASRWAGRSGRSGREGGRAPAPSSALTGTVAAVAREDVPPGRGAVPPPRPPPGHRRKPQDGGDHGAGAARDPPPWVLSWRSRSPPARGQSRPACRRAALWLPAWRGPGVGWRWPQAGPVPRADGPHSLNLSYQWQGLGGGRGTREKQTKTNGCSGKKTKARKAWGPHQSAATFHHG